MTVQADHRLRVLIADDEPAARGFLRRLIAGAPDLELVSECVNGQQACEEIRRLHPDLVFLDIEMPALNGLEVVQRVGLDRMPPTVFVTANERYAADAFEVDGLDYLLKPFGANRFARAVSKARSWIYGPAANEHRPPLATAPHAARAMQSRLRERLLVRNGNVQEFVRLADIVYIEADRNYVRLHSTSGCFNLRERMNGVVGRLDQSRFRRIHRSYIVNTEHIQKLLPWFSGERLLIMSDGTRLKLSRSFRQALDDLW